MYPHIIEGRMLEENFIMIEELKEPSGWDPVTSANLGKLMEEFFIDNISEDIRGSTLLLLCSLWTAGI